MFTCKVCGSEVERGQAYCATCGAEVAKNYEVKCPACGTRNNAGSRFCAHCGELLGVLRRPVCPICGEENLPGSKFCSRCGAPVEDPDNPFTEEDVLEMRKNKMNVDLMVKERMDGAEKEIARMKRGVEKDKAKVMQDIEDYRRKTNDELKKQAVMLDAYREKINEVGSDDVVQLKKLSSAVRNYSACYDIVRHNPVWVAYPCHFCYREGGNGWERTDPDPWHPDPLFKEYEQSIIYAANYDKWPWTSESADEYQYWSPLDNGPYFTRGHLLRSADRSGHDTEINRQTFYPTNIAPERLKHPLVHEELERLLSEVWTDDPDTQAREVTDTVYVVSGCYYEDDGYYVYDACHGDDRTPGKSKICYIPAAEYKVYLRSKSGKTGRPVQECPAEELMAIGFWLPQDLENTGQIKDEGWTWDWADFAMSVDEIESRIGGGFEFFPEVPDAVTASFNLADWGLQ